ncbi:MAG TPA: peptidylprolyl isomerase [Candidatus Acidoferrum sp.]|nr:peptidylprolyl isomerase [Candidatus Acidoferrum sp.]
MIATTLASVTSNAITRAAGAALLGIALLASAPTQAQPKPLDRVIAIVNEDVVLQSDFDDRWGQVQQQLDKSQGPKPALETVRKQLLDQLVLENLQMQMAKRVGVRIDDNQLNQYMAALAEQNKMTLEQFAKLLQDQGIYQATRDALRKQLILQQFQYGAVNNRIKISKQEVENYLRSEAGSQAIAPEYHVAHILIPGDPNDSRHAELAAKLYDQIQNGADIRQLTASREILGIQLTGGDLGWKKAEELPSVFADVVPKLDAGQLSKPFTSPNGHHIVKVLEIRGGSTLKLDQAKVRHILIKPNEIRTDPQAEALVKQLYQRIKNGEDFADVARQNTEDTQSIVSGGDLGWINDGMAPPDFMEVVHKSAVGALNEPVRLSTGWHIIQVMDHRVEDATEENKRKQAEGILRERKFQNELQNWLAELHDTNYIDIKADALK